MQLQQQSRLYFIAFLLWVFTQPAEAQSITAAGQPARLDIRTAGNSSVRITLKPLSYKADFPSTPVLAERAWPAPGISLTTISSPVKKKVGNLTVEVKSSPLTIMVSNAKGQVLQQLVMENDSRITFKLDDHPVLGMGEGGPQPERNANWRELPIEFDRRGRFHRMAPAGKAAYMAPAIP